MSVCDQSKVIAQVDVENLSEEALKRLNPRIADAIRAVQAERLGTEPIAWLDFSSHSQS